MKVPKVKLPRRSRRRRARGLLNTAGDRLAHIPGPSTNPATNLLAGDIAMRGVSLLIGQAIEKVMLRARYDAEKADGIVKGRTLAQSLVATGAARMAVRSLGGFAAVAGGLVAKSVFDRSVGRRQSAKQGDRQLNEMADKADKT